MTRTATRRPALTPQAKARQLKLLQATAERITRDHYIVFIAGITPKVVVFNRSTLKEKRLDLVQATAVSECCLRWQIGLYALCRSEQFDAMTTKLGAWRQLDVAKRLPGGGMGVLAR